jgi:hypothetical protein
VTFTAVWCEWRNIFGVSWYLHTPQFLKGEIVWPLFILPIYKAEALLFSKLSFYARIEELSTSHIQCFTSFEYRERCLWLSISQEGSSWWFHLYQNGFSKYPKQCIILAHCQRDCTNMAQYSVWCNQRLLLKCHDSCEGTCRTFLLTVAELTLNF